MQFKVLVAVAVFASAPMPIAAQEASEETNELQTDAPAVENPAATQRRVYKTDVNDVGMIIGGASEDAKAKVRRLPVRE